VSVPALACGSPVCEGDDAEVTAAALITACTGVPRGDLSIAVHRVHATDTSVPTPATEVDVLDPQGHWLVAQQSGWLRRRDGSWRALVCYEAGGALWLRAVHASKIRHPKIRAAVRALGTGVGSAVVGA
jgi:hypothetical protein